jgi:hypothetical protein
MAAQVAICMTALMGVAALALDGGLLMFAQQHAQAAADAAALAAAVDLSTDSSPYTTTLGTSGAGTIVGKANYTTYTSSSNLTADITHLTVTPHIPPTSGTWNNITSDAHGSYVEVIVQQDQPRYFSAIFGSGNVPVKARAVARWQLANQPAGIVVLNSANVDNALTVSGSATISVPGAIAVNDASTATNRAPLSVTNTASLVAGTMVRVNQANSLSSTQVYAPTSGSQTNVIHPASNVSDPLSSLPVPDPSTLTNRSTSKKTILTNTTLSPGIYQGGIAIISGTVTMQSGTYYIEGGGLSMSGGTLNGTAGVLIYNGQTNGTTGAGTANTVGSINISGGVAKLTAMTSGTYAGISIFQDSNATAPFTIKGASTTSVTGAVYAKAAAGNVSGSSTIAPGAAFISNTLTISGTSNFSLPTSAVQAQMKPDVRLVE